MIKLKRLENTEISIVQNLAKEIWNEHYSKILSQAQIDFMLNLFYSEEKIQEELNHENITWNLIYLDEIPVGYISCKIESEEIHLSKIYIKSETRGKGLGKIMLNHAIELTKNLNKKSLYLNVNKYNTDSIKFYESQDFTIIEEGIFDIGNGYVMDDFIMKKTITH